MKKASFRTLTGNQSSIMRSAFTLVELMISIALSLLLILGVNQVFTYTTQAVGAGEAINSAIRNSRAVQGAFSGDFGGIVGNGNGPNDSASMIISSRAWYGFRNAKDLGSEGTISTNAPTGGYPSNNAAFIDLNGDGQFGDATVPGEVVWPCNYNYRNHRLDCISFFSRDTFHRQTGNQGTIVASQASQEAWVWYGHVWLPDNNGPDSNGSQINADFQPPTSNSVPPPTFPLSGNESSTAVIGPASNPNNYFGSQLVLGRMAVLLQEQNDLIHNTGYIYDQNGNVQWFLNRSAGAYGTPTINSSVIGNLSPLFSTNAINGANATGGTGSDQGPYYMQDSRLDLASTSISNFQKKLINYLGANVSPYNDWWDTLMDGNPTPYSNSPTYTNYASANPASALKFSTRFKCNPFVPKPMQSVNFAEAAPYLVGGCSQFMVEFAGDFVTQDNDPTHVDVNGNPSRGTSGAYHTAYGDIIATTPTNSSTGQLAATVPDGQIDFTIVSGAKQIKWYGMPRGSSVSSVHAANPPAVAGNPSLPTGDVVPVRDWLQSAVDPVPVTTPPGITPPAPDAIITPMSFEKVLPPYKNLTANYIGSAGMIPADARAGYTCAFGPYDLRPKLIRITITIEDPTGRLPDGQTYQYVFQVP